VLYLSAITITTLGFGDITPVSESARMSIALEAVLGIVVIGLFLNSLAMRVRRRQVGGDESGMSS
jgi:Ion channel